MPFYPSVRFRTGYSFERSICVTIVRSPQVSHRILQVNSGFSVFSTQLATTTAFSLPHRLHDRLGGGLNCLSIRLRTNCEEWPEGELPLQCTVAYRVGNASFRRMQPAVVGAVRNDAAGSKRQPTIVELILGLRTDPGKTMPGSSSVKPN